MSFSTLLLIALALPIASSQKQQCEPLAARQAMSLSQANNVCRVSRRPTSCVCGKGPVRSVRFASVGWLSTADVDACFPVSCVCRDGSSVATANAPKCRGPVVAVKRVRLRDVRRLCHRGGQATIIPASCRCGRTGRARGRGASGFVFANAAEFRACRPTACTCPGDRQPTTLYGT